MVDSELLRLEVVKRLPVHRRWLVNDVPLDFDFSRAGVPLQTIQPGEVCGCDIDPAWRKLLLFCDEDYADGGGARPFVGIHQDTGAVYGLDVERGDSQIYLINSSMDAYIQTFLTIEKLLQDVPQDVEEVSGALRKIDQVYLQSSWKDLVDELGTH